MPHEPAHLGGGGSTRFATEGRAARPPPRLPPPYLSIALQKVPVGVRGGGARRLLAGEQMSPPLRNVVSSPPHELCPHLLGVLPTEHSHTAQMAAGGLVLPLGAPVVHVALCRGRSVNGAVTTHPRSTAFVPPSPITSRPSPSPTTLLLLVPSSRSTSDLTYTLARMMRRASDGRAVPGADDCADSL